MVGGFLSSPTATGILLFMSATRIYRAWIDKEGDELVVKTVTCATNCSPKPRRYELSKGCAAEWKRFDIADCDGVRAFVSSLAHSYAGHGCFELSRLTGEQAWRRWRNRFKRAGGPDVGKCPGAITWDNAPDFIADPWPATIEISSGQLVTQEIAELLVESGVRAPITVLPKGAQFVLKEHRWADGAIGFISGGDLHYYAHGKRRWGRPLDLAWSDAYFRVATTVKLKPDKSDLIPHSKVLFSAIQNSDIVLRREGSVLTLSSYSDGFDCVAESEIGKYPKDPEIVVFTSANGAKAANILNEKFAANGWVAESWKS